MKAIYLDSSAIIKLFIEEPETAELNRWLSDLASAETVSFVSSDIARVEVLGKLSQLAISAEPAIAFFSSLILVPIKKVILDYAINSRAIGLKTLDAIHHSTAIYLSENLSSVVCYDKQLAKALAVSGLTVVNPGPTEAN